MNKTKCITQDMLTQDMLNYQLDRLDELHGRNLAIVMAKRPDCPLDRLGELNGCYVLYELLGLAYVMAKRSDCPLDRLDELHGWDLAYVMANRKDCPLDRLSELNGWNLAYVKEKRGLVSG